MIILNRKCKQRGDFLQVKLALCTDEELPFRERDFLRIYRGYIGRKLGDYPRHLAGSAETENASKGYEVEAPLLIGDKTAAISVMRNGSDIPRLPVSPLTDMTTLLADALSGKEVAA
ncbi:MAG: DUF6475 domain-containing protein [Cardiobacteriaceae bacterium]|nr:DUF6475 domain-containing protein [Cardiobacteriaceae bacterium]